MYMDQVCLQGGTLVSDVPTGARARSPPHLDASRLNSLSLSADPPPTSLPSLTLSLVQSMIVSLFSCEFVLVEF